MKAGYKITLENGVQLVISDDLYQCLKELSAVADRNVEQYIQIIIESKITKEEEKNVQIITEVLYEFCLNLCRRREKALDSLNKY